jgi:hypothetical protein
MIAIEKGLKRQIPEHEFVGAIYALFNEFRNAYLPEWKRIDGCEHMYRGDHWYDIPDDGKKSPRPTTPILFSTIENVRADITDEFPEAIIKPEDLGDEMLAKVLTELVAQNLEACDYDAEYDKLTHDLIVCGWMAQEVGWDGSAHRRGCAYLRTFRTKTSCSTRYTDNIQDGRAVFSSPCSPMIGSGSITGAVQGNAGRLFLTVRPPRRLHQHHTADGYQLQGSDRSVVQLYNAETRQYSVTW